MTSQAAVSVQTAPAGTNAAANVVVQNAQAPVVPNGHEEYGEYSSWNWNPIEWIFGHKTRGYVEAEGRGNGEVAVPPASGGNGNVWYERTADGRVIVHQMVWHPSQ